MAGAITPVVVEEVGAATVPTLGYLSRNFQNGLHALGSQVVCTASLIMFFFKGVNADGPPAAYIASVLLEKEY